MLIMNNKNESQIVKDLANDMFFKQDKVLKKIENREYGFADIWKALERGVDAFTPQQQMAILKEYSVNDKGVYDFRVPLHMAQSLGTDVDVVYTLMNQTFSEYANNSENVKVLSEMESHVKESAEKTFCYKKSYELDKDSVLNYLEDKATSCLSLEKKARLRRFKGPSCFCRKQSNKCRE